MSKSELNGNTTPNWDIAQAIDEAGWLDLILIHAAIGVADLWWSKSLEGDDFNKWTLFVFRASARCCDRFRAMRGYLPWAPSAPKVEFGPRIDSEIDKKINALAERVWREGDFSSL